EHIQNPGFALRKAHALLNKKGWLFVIVPPHKSQIVGGHVITGWNIGQLMYLLLLNSFDIKNGHFIKHGYNICGFVQKSKEKLPKLLNDKGDIERLSQYFPMKVYQGFEGDISSVNWPPTA
ncbi:MAG: hypothetical protein ACOCQ4_03150, partial [bacterium]